MGRNGQYKQEILLFGLADWVMAKWKEVIDTMRDEREARQESNFSVGVSMVKDSVETICYVSATGAIPV